MTTQKDLLIKPTDEIFKKDSEEESMYQTDNNVEFIKQKKTIRMAPALIRQPECHNLIRLWPQSSSFLFETKEQAKNNFGDWFVQWPLTINGVEQWVDVPVEDE